jgi:hypothetical protein
MSRLIRAISQERSMSDERQATSHAELIQQIMDSRVPKNEREWAAGREIERLRGVVASQLESIQNLGAAPHCPTCACGADQPSDALLLRKARDFVGKSRCSMGHSVDQVWDRGKAGTCLYCKAQVELYEALARAADPTSSTCDTQASPSS